MKKNMMKILIISSLIMSIGWYQPAKALSPFWAFQVVGQSNAVLMCPYLETAILNYYGANAELICSAVNGSSIASWQPGQTNYINALNDANTAKDNGYIIKAIILNQGEYDAEFSTSTNWAQQASNFLDNFRIDIGNQYAYVFYTELGKKPVVPSGFQNYVNWETIRKAQHELRYNRATFFMIDKSPMDVYDITSPPYAHDISFAQQAITNQMMIYMRGWIPTP